MPKFGKAFKNQQIADWKEHYVNYKCLKQFIKKCSEKMKKEDENKKGRKNSKESEKDIFSIEKLGTPSCSMPAEGYYSDFKPEESEIPVLKISSEISPQTILSEFIDSLDREIKNVYLFFVNKERDLYLLINSHLHIREAYASFNVPAIAKEFQELNNISNITFNIVKYITDNMTSIKKILKKFDKKFQKYYGKIGYWYIERNIEAKNSDLLYILQFKIIDEVSTLLEDLMNELMSKYNLRLKETNFSGQNLLNGSEETLVDGNELKNVDLNKFIIMNAENLTTNLFQIDEHYQNFRNIFKEWNSYLKQSLKMTSKVFAVTKETSLGGESIILSKEKGNAHLSKADSIRLDIRRESFDSTNLFSTENGSNIYITLFHTFLFMFSYSIVIPSNRDYVKMLKYHHYFSGFMMCLTPLGALISMFYTRLWVSKSYKQPILFATVLMVIGNLLYSFAGSWNNIIIMGFGRLVLGLGSNRVANREYLLNFIPKRKLTRYLLYYQIFSLIGLALGLLAAIPIIYLHEVWIGNSFFNGYTNPSWFCALISLIFIIFILLSYSEPLKDNFNVYTDEATGTASFSRPASFAETISKKDSNMINELNERLSEINQLNKFTDTNMVAKCIDEITVREKSSMSYISKSYGVFISLIFTIRLTVETLLIVSPLYTQEVYYYFDSKYIALLMGVSLLFVFPIGMIYDNYISSRIKDRRAIIYTLLFCIASNLLIINTWYTSLIQYCIMFFCLIISSVLLENIAANMFAKIIPSDYECCGIPGSLVLQVFTTLPRVLGALMLSLCGLVEYEELNRIVFGITLFFFLLNLILVLMFYSNLRVKAIARILRGQAPRKIKP